MFRGQKANLLNDWLSDTDELQYDDFFAERKTAENPMIKMAKAMGVEMACSMRYRPAVGRTCVEGYSRCLQAHDGYRHDDLY